MQTVTTIGLDIAKSVFQVHGIDAEGKVVIRRQLKRRYVLGSYGSWCLADQWLTRLCSGLANEWLVWRKRR